MNFTEEALAVGRVLERTIVPHSRFEMIASYIEKAVEIGETGIFSGVRVAAPSGSGKTALLRYLDHRLSDRYGVGGQLPMISASLKENPSVSQVQGELLGNFNYPLSGVQRLGTNNDVNMVLVRAIEQHRVRLIAIDEFQHVFLSNGSKVATAVLDWLKRLMNLTRVPVTLVGTEVLDRLEGVDSQLTSRIPTVVRMGHFQLNAEWKAFLQALASSVDAVDLTPLCGPFAKPLFMASRGSPRMSKGLLVHAVCSAVSKGEKVLTAETMREAFRQQIGPLPDEENPFAAP
ncbi:TniB family NTP-binding protein [Achromobacter marplatensis]